MRKGNRYTNTRLRYLIFREQEMCSGWEQELCRPTDSTASPTADISSVREAAEGRFPRKRSNTSVHAPSLVKSIQNHVRSLFLKWKIRETFLTFLKYVSNY